MITSSDRILDTNLQPLPPQIRRRLNGSDYDLLRAGGWDIWKYTPPVYDSATHKLDGILIKTTDGCTEGVVAKTAAEITAEDASKVSQYKIQLLNAMEAYINHKGHADAQGNSTKPEERIAVHVFGRIDRKGAANMPVSKSITTWADSVANLYYYRLGVLEELGSAGWLDSFLDYREAGLMPGSIGAALQE